jgi:bifunctional non-homologous end joining protein LigD
VSQPPAGDSWLHETKFDGYRILWIEESRATLWSRNAKDWTERFPAIARAAACLPVDRALVDGEVAVLLPDGTTSLQALQNVLSDRSQASPVYFAFDLLHLDGRDLTAATLETRKDVRIL